MGTKQTNDAKSSVGDGRNKINNDTEDNNNQKKNDAEKEIINEIELL